MHLQTFSCKKKNGNAFLLPVLTCQSRDRQVTKSVKKDVTISDAVCAMFEEEIAFAKTD